jgi:hypothetical protein
MEIFSGFITNTLPALIDKMVAASEWFDKNQWAIYALAGAILGALAPSLIAIIGHFIVMAGILAPWMIGGAIIGGLIAGIIWLVQNWDMVKQKAIEIWTAVADFFVSIFDKIKNSTMEVWEGVKNFFVAIWEAIKLVFELYLAFTFGLVITVFELLGIDIVKVFTTIAEFFVSFWEGTKIVFEIALSAIQVVWTTVWGAISSFFSTIWEGIKSVVNLGLGWISQKFSSWTEPIKKAWTSLWEGIGAVLGTVWEGIKSLIKGNINWIIEKINWVIQKINAVTLKGAGTLGFSAPQIDQIPLLAKGGIVTRPTLAMIGEAGPEAVIPLSRAKGMTGDEKPSGVTIINNFYNPQIRDNSDINKLTDEIDRRIDTYFKPLILNHKITA